MPRSPGFIRSEWQAACGQNILVQSEFQASGQNILVRSEWQVARGQNIGILRPRPNSAPTSWRLLLDICMTTICHPRSDCYSEISLQNPRSGHCRSDYFERFSSRILASQQSRFQVTSDHFEDTREKAKGLTGWAGQCNQPLSMICSIHSLMLKLLLNLKTLHN